MKKCSGGSIRSPVSTRSGLGDRNKRVTAMKRNSILGLVAVVILIIVIIAAFALMMGGTKSNGPALSIQSPTSESSVAGPNITVTISVQNFNIVNKFGQASVAGEGHVHYFMDVTPPTTPNVEAFTDPGTYAASVNTSYVWTNVTPGAHTFSAELVDNNHAPLQPAVVVSINVTVVAPPRSVTVSITAHNFAFSTSVITVPAGASVKVNFNNQDSGTTHTFSVYTSSAATTPVFVGPG
jgi:hypothetical protein